MNFKPGQNVTCTITKAPRTPDDVSTISRLMRQDASIRRGLRKAQTRRRQNQIVYNRGNRDWVSRRACSKIVSVQAGQSWTMPYTPVLARDLKAVEAFLAVKPA